MFFHQMNGAGSRGGSGRPVDTALYDRLNVRPNASNEEIKRSYRQLAKEYHPDKNSHHGEKFKEISYAYEILSNPERKRIYDARGLSGIQEGGSEGGAEDLFSQLFGGGGGHPFGSMFGGAFGGGRRRPMRGQDTMHPLKVSLEDLYNGKTAKLQLNKQVICTTCRGIGGREGANQRCRGCKGAGMKVQMRQLAPGMVQQVQSVCPDCRGEGNMIADKDRCKRCNGKRTVQEKKLLEVHVDKGMKDGQKITFAGEGDQEPDIQSGDVVIVLQLEQHETFSRSGDDLFLKREISLNEALTGVSFVVTHLDGRTLLVQSSVGDVIDPNSVRGIEGEGMPHLRYSEQRGRLFIQFTVAFPESHFLSAADQYNELENLLPPRLTKCPLPNTNDEHVEEVGLLPFEESYFGGANVGGKGKDAYREDSDDEDEAARHGAGPQGVNCAQF